MEPSFTLLRVRGIPIGAHWSWLLVVALVVWSLGTGLFPATYPDLPGSTYLLMGVVAALLFFGSVVLHELGHAFRALDEGIRIEGITLWLFGGVAHLGGLPPSPGAEFRVAIAGPAVTVVLTGVFFVLTLLGDQLSWPGALQGVLDYLTRINLIVLAFNLVPALPLDGGRVLRAWLWQRQRSFTAATRSASRVGLAFGIMLVTIGLLGLFTGTGAGGIWLAFLGWFVIQAAQSEAAVAAVRQAIGGLQVRDAMHPDPMVVPPDLTVSDFMDQAGRNRRFSTYPVVDGGILRGSVSLRAAAAVPPNERDHRRVGDLVAEVGREGDGTVVVDPDRPLFEALQTMPGRSGRAWVVAGDRLVGVLSASDILRTIEIEQARDPAREPGARGPGLLVWLVVGAVVLLAGALLYHPPYVVISPGDTFDVAADVNISGVPVDDLDGTYLATSVRIDQPSALGTLVAALRTDREVLPVSAVLPRRVSPEELARSQRELFDESRELAAAAAARAVGLPVSVRSNGVRVTNVVRGSPAAQELERGDVIVAVDGQPIDDAGELRRLIQSRPAGSEFRITAERDGERSEISLRSKRLSALAGGPGIGVAVENRDLQIDLPFEVSFEERPEVGGPSAGLAYALVMADLLSPDDLARRRTVAATGTVEPDGEVGLVGGVTEKAVAAAQDGADVFLVPAEEVEEVEVSDLEVQGVETVAQSLEVLRVAT